MRGADDHTHGMCSYMSPEQRLRALLPQVLYSVRSERLLVEQLQYTLLFRWFIGLNMDAPVWSATPMSTSRSTVRSVRRGPV